MARPTRYKSDFARQAHLGCRLGMDNADLARLFSVSPATLYRWLDQYPEFATAAAIGKAESAHPVQKSQYRRAIGGDYFVERVFMPRGARKPVVARYRRRVLGDPKAGFCWLRNRCPAKWRVNAPASVRTETHRPEVLRKEIASRIDSHNHKRITNLFVTAVTDVMRLILRLRSGLGAPHSIILDEPAAAIAKIRADIGS